MLKVAGAMHFLVMEVAGLQWAAAACKFIHQISLVISVQMLLSWCKEYWILGRTRFTVGGLGGGFAGGGGKV